MLCISQVGSGSYKLFTNEYVLQLSVGLNLTKSILEEERNFKNVFRIAFKKMGKS